MIGSRKHKDHAICQDLFNNTFIICKLIKIKAQECFRQIATIVWDHDFSAALYIICDFPISENECKMVTTLPNYFFMKHNNVAQNILQIQNCSFLSNIKLISILIWF